MDHPRPPDDHPRQKEVEGLQENTTIAQGARFWREKRIERKYATFKTTTT